MLKRQGKREEEISDTEAEISVCPIELGGKGLVDLG